MRMNMTVNEICCECQFRRSNGCGRGRCVYEDFVEERRKGMNKIFTLQWLKCAAIRAVKTLAQSAIATIGTAAAMGEVNWKLVLSASALSAVLSLLTSLAGLPEVKGD
jgi:hypothetical protein